LLSPSSIFEKYGTASYEKSFAVLKTPLFFTGNAFLQFPEKIEDLAEDNDREHLQARCPNAAIRYATFVRSG
jgi:hypothetical protein